jgi:hypothetical protein
MEPEEPREHVWDKRGFPFARAFRFPTIPLRRISLLVALIGAVSGLVGTSLLGSHPHHHVSSPTQIEALFPSSPQEAPSPPSSPAEKVSITTEDLPGEPCRWDAARSARIAPNPDEGTASAVAYSSKGSVWLYDVAKDERHLVVPGDDSCWISGARFVDDDHLIVPGSTFREIDLRTGSTRVLWSIKESDWIAESALDPKGELVATLSSTPGYNFLFAIRDLATGEARSSRKLGYICYCDAAAPSDLAWSEDGSLLAGVFPRRQGPGRLVVFDRSGRILLTREDATVVRWIAGTHDLLYETRVEWSHGDWHVLDTSTGASRVVLRDVSLSNPAVSPDGRRAAWTEEDGSGILLADIATGRSRPLTGHFAFPLWLSEGDLAISRIERCNCEGWGFSTTGVGMKISLGSGKETRLAMGDTSDAEALFLKPVQKEPTQAIEGPRVPSDNDAPVFTPVDDQSVNELERVSFTVEAVDPQGGSLTYQALGLPRHATFDPVERRFTWRPRPGQDGTWVIKFTATDANGATSALTVRIKVRALADRLISLIPKPLDL